MNLLFHAGKEKWKLFRAQKKLIMETRETELFLADLFFDICILNATIILTAWYSPIVSLWDYHEMGNFLLHANLSCIVAYALFSSKNLFLRDGFRARFKRITLRTLLYILVSGIFVFMIMTPGYSRIFFFEYIPFFYLAQLGFYWSLYRFMYYRRRSGFRTHRTLIVGMNDTNHFLRKLIVNNPMLGFKFVGFVTSDTKDDPEVLGNPDDLPHLIDKYCIQMVFVTLSLYGESIRGKEYLRICNKKGIRIRFIPENQRLFQTHMKMETVGNVQMINPQEIPLDDINARLFKRIFDLMFSGMIILFIFSWLFPILALLIKMSSKGPVFFIQKRTCINNRIFNCLKFRSMCVNPDADEKQAIVNDSRINCIGRFLRRTNMDELPQFINVFLGQMSVSGPRPHMLKHTYQYSELIDFYQVRHHVKPGITGWAQINGFRGETDELWKMEKRVQYDIEYIENWSFWWDMKIIVQTVIGKNVFKNAR